MSIDLRFHGLFPYGMFSSLQHTETPSAQPRPGSVQPLGRQIVGLDALRIIAALLVLAFHLYFWDWTPGNPNGHLTHAFDFFQPFVWFGWIGVEIFFVISGFVIAYSASGVSSAHFLQHRITRLFPAALICATITAVSILIGTHHAHLVRLGLSWLGSILFLPGPIIDPSYWTLTIEVTFYALVYVLLLLKRFDKLPGTMASIGGISTFYWMMVFAWNRLPHAARASLDWLRFLGEYPNTLVHHGCYFAVGVFLWLCLLDRISWRRMTVLCVCTFGGVLQIINRSSAMGSIGGFRFHSIVPVAVWLGSILFVIFAVSGNDAAQVTVGRRGVAVLRRLGLMTYPLYLVHQQIGEALIHRLRGTFGNVPALVLVTAAMLALAFVISTYLEPPLRNAMKRMIPATRQT